MKNTYFVATGLSFALALTFGSCSESHEDSHKGNEVHNESVEYKCTYSYDENSTNFEWTSYKTNKKKPVAGTFNEITVESESSDDPKAVLQSINFSMNTASVETNDEDRNKKVAELFFGTINTPTITGSIKSLSDDGEAVLTINMNGVDFDVEGEYTLENNVFTYTSSIDVSNWNGIPGIDALNDECKDLHTGEDGVSKLWSEVSLNLTTTLNEDCK